MAKNNRTETWRKYVLSVLSLTVATTLSLGVFTACSDGSDTSDDEDTTVSQADTQLLRNGNFEFYSDKDVEDVIDRHGVVNTPNNWTFSAGSPSSDTASGIINTMEKAVKKAMLANNFEILEIHHMKDWVSITAKPKK